MNNTSYIYGNLALDTYVSEPAEASCSFKVVNGNKGLKPIAPLDGSSKAQPVHMSKIFCFVMGITTIFLMAASIFVCIISPFGAETSGEAALAAAAHQTITVQKGETLWEIAQEYPVDNATVKETVAAMRTWNELDSPILQPGQSLIVAA